MERQADTQTQRASGIERDKEGDRYTETESVEIERV